MRGLAAPLPPPPCPPLPAARRIFARSSWSTPSPRTRWPDGPRSTPNRTIQRQLCFVASPRAACLAAGASMPGRLRKNAEKLASNRASARPVPPATVCRVFHGALPAHGRCAEGYIQVRKNPLGGEHERGEHAAQASCEHAERSPYMCARYLTTCSSRARRSLSLMARAARYDGPKAMACRRACQHMIACIKTRHTSPATEPVPVPCRLSLCAAFSTVH